MSTLVDKKEIVDSYLTNLVSKLTELETSPELEEVQKWAISQLANQKLPGKNDEDWRFTDLSELTSFPWELSTPKEIDTETLAQFILPEVQTSRIVLLNGVYMPQLSDVSGLPTGVYVGNWQGLSDKQKTKVIEYLTSNQSHKEVFSLLNSANVKELVIIWAEANLVVAQPIHVLNISIPSTYPSLSQPCVVAIAEKNSQFTLIEQYSTITPNCSDIPQNLPYFNNIVTEIFLEDNAQIKHNRIQRDSGDAFHIGNTVVNQKRDSHYSIIEVNMGAKLSRHNLLVLQKGEQTTTNLQGLSLVGRKQLTDTHTEVSLNHPYGITNQLHKCIVDDTATVVFNGKIIVPQTAQLTSANQLNRNLMLSEKGKVNTKPELQITADNVKCAHGATITQLETDEIFYLQSRGLSKLDARHLLLDAFGAEILEMIAVDSLKQRLSQCVACRNY